MGSSTITISYGSVLSHGALTFADVKKKTIRIFTQHMERKPG